MNELIYDRRGLSGSDLALDLFGVFLAVRYPQNDPQIFAGETHVNLFRTLFSDLAQTDVLLKDKPANESYLMINKKLHVLVKDGKALDRIELVP